MATLKQAAVKLRDGARHLVGAFSVGQAYNIGLALHRASLGLFMAITEADAYKTYMESGPSLFCSCCGERWHAFSHASCPNGCPWVYTSFRAPAWAEDTELLQRVRAYHSGRMVAVNVPGGEAIHLRKPLRN